MLHKNDQMRPPAHRLVRFTTSILLVFAVSGCKHELQRGNTGPVTEVTMQGEVSGAAVEPAFADRYVKKTGVRYEQPTAFPENPMPVYPQALLAARLPPVQLKVRLVIDEQGRVKQTNALTELTEARQSFMASIQLAVQSWKFLPLVQISESEETTMMTVGEFTTAYPGKAIALPFHQDYVFVFQQVDGKPSVTAER